MVRGIERVDVSSQPRLQLSMGGMGSLVPFSIQLYETKSVYRCLPG